MFLKIFYFRNGILKYQQEIIYILLAILSSGRIIQLSIFDFYLEYKRMYVLYLYISRYICIVKYIIENMVLSVIKLQIFLDVFEGSVTFSSKITKKLCRPPSGPCDWSAGY